MDSRSRFGVGFALGKVQIEGSEQQFGLTLIIIALLTIMIRIIRNNDSTSDHSNKK